MPSGRLVTIGAWEDGAFIGAVVFGRGASSEIGSPFRLRQDQICELCRIALAQHETPVSRILSIAVKLLRKQSPDLRAVISFADPEHGHDGRGVYAAARWTYLGETAREALLYVYGRETHARTISSRYGTRDLRWPQANVDPHARRIDCPPKHKYALGLTPDMCARLARLAQPYPNRSREGSRASAATGRLLPVEAGATPSPSLQSSEVAHVG